MGLAAIRTAKRITVEKGPTLLPPAPEEDPRKPQNVKLLAEFWEELKEAAKFHTEVFREMDPNNPSVSRNDVIENFLRWALDVYWDDKGGRPKNAADRAAKVAATAAKLKALKDQKSSSKK